MAGWITEKYSRIIKAPTYMYMKEASEIRKVVRSLRQIYYYIYVKLPEEVEIDHKIRESLKDQRRVVKLAITASDKDANFAINIQVQEDAVLDIIKKIEDRWAKIGEIIKKEDSEKHAEIVKKLRAADLTFRKILINVMKEIEREDHDMYKDIMQIIKGAEKDDETVMVDLKTRFKNMDPSQLGRWAAKMEVKGVKKYINGIKKDKAEIDKLVKELGKLLKGKGKKKASVIENFDVIVTKLNVLIRAAEKDISQMFKKSYLAIKRDLMLNFVLLGQLDDLKEKIEVWVATKQEPSAPEKKIYKDILKAEEKVGEHARVIAQGFRILFHKEKALENF